MIFSGQFGRVYKGILRDFKGSDGETVAIKTLKCKYPCP